MKTALILALAGAALAGDPAVVREGDWWVSTITGAENLAPSARLRIGAHGDVTVAGARQNTLSYALRVRVKARNEAEARALLKACGVKLSREGPWTVVQVTPGRGEPTLNVKAPHAVETLVSTSEGAVHLYDLAGRVNAVSGGGRMKADRIAGDLRLRTSGGEIWLGTIDGSAYCVTGGGAVTAGVVRGEAFLETGAGDITLEEAGGLVRASTVGGAVRIGRAGRGVIASTGGGPIEVGESRGEVNLRNSGGPVRVGAATGVKCENASGGIKLINVYGSLRASTAIGSILAQLLAGRAVADSFLTTGRGDITVVIPSNVGVRVYAETETAANVRGIVSDFPGISTQVRGGQLIAEGDINGGGPVLRILGSGGTIFIKRQ